MVMRQLLTCKFLIAVIAFGVVSTMAAAAHFCQGKPTDYSYHSWTSWAIDDFLAPQSGRPQVAFLGSSLMLVPLSGVDADVLGQNLDGAKHHHSAYFEQQFNSATGMKVSSFNFALPGEMPSDAYLITKFLLKDGKRPDVLVYGVGPRDFMDNLLPSPSATDPYRFLSRFGDISPIASLAMPDWNERFNYELGRLLYFYGQRVNICHAFSNAVTAVVDKCENGKVKTMGRDLVHQLLPDYKPFQLESGEAYFRPSTEAELANFVDNLPEYRKRYKTVNERTFTTQMHFFSELLHDANERGTHAVVIAMPITDLNRELISDKAWARYKNTVRGVATNNGASFIDLSESERFSRKDFGDTVHLHSRGGRKLLDVLVENMATDSAVKAALQRPSELAGKAGGRQL